MNARWMLVPALLGVMSLLVHAEERGRPRDGSRSSSSSPSGARRRRRMRRWRRGCRALQPDLGAGRRAGRGRQARAAGHADQRSAEPGRPRRSGQTGPARCADRARSRTTRPWRPTSSPTSPGRARFPVWASWSPTCRERDPAHLAYINLFPTYANEAQLGVSADAAERAKVGYPQNFAGVGTSDKTVLAYREHLKKFIEIVKPDLISYDHYHFLQERRRQPVFPEPRPDPRGGPGGRQAVPEHHPGLHDREGVAAAQRGRDAVPGLHDDGLRRARHQLLHLLGARRPTAGCTRMASPRRWPRKWPRSTPRWPSSARR